MIRAESSSPQKRSGGLGRGEHVADSRRWPIIRGQGPPQTPWRSRRKYETRGASHPSSRFYPQRTEASVSLHHVRIREASDHKCFCQPLVRLPGIGRKAKRNSGAGLHDPSHFSQTDGRIRPDLHGVNRQRLIKAVVIEWQANHGATPQVDTTVLDGGLFRARACSTISRDGSIPATCPADARFDRR
jgi:hypothetical protein